MLTWVLVGLMVAVVATAVLKSKKAARRRAERRKRARMIRHANQQHALVKNNRLAGVYGDYPVPPELRGIGFPWAR